MGARLAHTRGTLSGIPSAFRIKTINIHPDVKQPFEVAVHSLICGYRGRKNLKNEKILTENNKKNREWIAPEEKIKDFCKRLNEKETSYECVSQALWGFASGITESKERAQKRKPEELKIALKLKEAVQIKALEKLLA